MPDNPSHWSRYIKRGFALLLTGLALDASAQGIASIDWTLAETLVAIDAPLHGVAQVDAYHDWVVEPRLNDQVIDLGLRSQPNVELLAQLDPAHILISPMFASLAPRLSRIGQVDSFHLYTPGRDTWDEALAMTRALGVATARSPAAESLIAATEQHLREQRRRVPDQPRPLLLVQFVDERHVRVFGQHSLFHAVLDRLGLENAWQEKTNAWGFSLVGLERLIGLDARLVVVKPYPVGIEEKLSHSGLWQHQPSVRDGSLITLSPAWSFGALPSARRFAQLLVDALNDASEA